MYRCDLATPALDGTLGATHGIDLPLVFNNLPVPLLDGQSAAATVAAAMSGTWLSFARTGDPSHSLLPDWPPYSLDRRATMLFNSTSTLADDPDSDERQAWDDRTRPNPQQPDDAAPPLDEHGCQTAEMPFGVLDAHAQRVVRCSRSVSTGEWFVVCLARRV